MCWLNGVSVTRVKSGFTRHNYTCFYWVKMLKPKFLYSYYKTNLPRILNTLYTINFANDLPRYVGSAMYLCDLLEWFTEPS